METKRALVYDESTMTFVFRVVAADAPAPAVAEHRFASVDEADAWAQPAREPEPRADGETEYDRAYRRYVERMRNAWRRPPERTASHRPLPQLRQVRRGAPRSRRQRRPTHRPAAHAASADGPAPPRSRPAADRGGAS